jgi:hypothetical protein
MRGFKTLMLAALVASAFALPAMAAESGMKSDMMMMMMPDGTKGSAEMADPKMQKEMSDMMMKHGKPMTQNSMMMMHDGKIYMMDDMKMSDGKMMSEHMKMMK